MAGKAWGLGGQLTGDLGTDTRIRERAEPEPGASEWQREAAPLCRSRAQIGCLQCNHHPAAGSVERVGCGFPSPGSSQGAAQDRQEGCRFNPSGEGKVPVIRRGQSSSDKMVMTGSPLSPGPTISFSVVILASVDLPSRGTR